MRHKEMMDLFEVAPKSPELADAKLGVAQSLSLVEIQYEHGMTLTSIPSHQRPPTAGPSPNKRKRDDLCCSKLARAIEAFESTHRSQLSLQRGQGKQPPPFPPKQQSLAPKRPHSPFLPEVAVLAEFPTGWVRCRSTGGGRVGIVPRCKLSFSAPTNDHQTFHTLLPNMEPSHVMPIPPLPPSPSLSTTGRCLNVCPGNPSQPASLFRPFPSSSASPFIIH